MQDRARYSRAAAAVLTLSLGLGGCGTAVVNPVTGRTELTVMDEASEVAEGAKAHQQVMQEYQSVANPKLQAYVNELGQRLAQASHRPQLSWHFTVLDSPEVNAFALPGGYVYVTRGIMAYLDNEADLAGVMGHEIGHVTARHGAQRATRQQTAGFGVLAASVLGAVLEAQGLGGASQALGQASQSAAAGYIASYSRDQELQADELGAEYLSRSHYRPQNMVDVIGVLKQQERFAADQAKAEGRPAPQGANWLASHPSNDQRLAQISAIAASYEGETAPYRDDGRERYLKAIDGMTFGESPAQGLSRGRNFYHEGLGLAITAPPGWKIHNGSDALTLINAAEDAGLALKPVPAQAGSNHEDIVRRMLNPEQGQLEKLTLNGLPASHFSGVVRNPQGARQNVELTLISGPNAHQYVLQYLSRDAYALSRAMPQMREAEASFRPLTAADRQAAQPWTLHLQAFPVGGFAQLAKSSPLGNRAEAQLRLLNGALDTDPKPGQRIKVIAKGS
ncbi:M48 family metalloprotease [Roseateles koreensis]|uniref:M48 family metalloprotease n=1 Tax=Roseateles koreensis TaxID=2987526 RepID=A0ABT5KPC0_9BURK|nr:M48 family metalloprotease [Roseateles koreensis]MDC8784773.1 M48 family metalloprotease [Roseateles koreensis]